MPKGIVIPVDEDQPLRVAEFSDLSDYQQAVGGLIEATDIEDLMTTIYSNEEGKIARLPMNLRASVLWWAHEPSVRERDYLVGDVVLIGLPDRNGDTTDLPAALMDTLLSECLWRVEVQLEDEAGQWRRDQDTYEDYFDALSDAVGMALLWSSVSNVRVVPA